MRRWIVILAVMLVGCSAPGTPASPGASSTPAGPSPTPAASGASEAAPAPSKSGPARFETAPPLPSSTGRPVQLPAERLEAIKADLRTDGIDTAGLKVVSASAVTWNDGSLGCPEPGVAYTQALVDGMQVIVEAGGERYDYRFGKGPVPKRCLDAGGR